ncbi:uncharacterized protein L969DRAFT_54596 [Mixia osmundae IAM 14324]|uniref:General alpha-glucoside permease n=1 Tax=Mixia osmundae (strain CBS 9802 / IAM 14324 / JCM 22182 / KY 12970) TaxID=764103 RepID=G7E1D4_MIXOS|nr:uncharacterized protein L969DRAFT_54596 [Mixia osmundae IAM 14324]KEI36596.1 hypothetical protein L969DRAFT_54596 [Mixia osmundae IAM 14324]GAA96644.1 hypothetical protein E5Q_03315 [Mixia osmundae IAM 14324]
MNSASEAVPMLSAPAQHDEEAPGQPTWLGQAKIRGAYSWLRYCLLTVSMLGLQLIWSTEMAFASPFLVSLGMSKSLMSLVFLAGPLSGLIMQPLIGSVADRCKLRLGRRRPFMLGGSLVCAFALLMLGFAKQIAGWSTSEGSRANATLSICIAVFAIYLVDFSINAVQASDRALVVDTLPAQHQQEANVYAAAMFGVGAVIGFFVGNIDLVKLLPLFGSSQLQILSILASFFLIVAHCITAFAVSERVLLQDAPGTQTGFLHMFKTIYTTFWMMPNVIRKICFIQLASWVGWFPILFFASLYVGEIYDRKHTTTVSDPREVSQAAERAGSRAMLWHAIIALATSIIMPYFVRPSMGPSRVELLSQWTPPQDSSLVSHLIRTAKAFSSRLPTLPLPWLTLTVTWFISQIVFTLLMLATFVVDSVFGASTIIALTGFCFAITNWCPVTLISQAILHDTSNVTDMQPPATPGMENFALLQPRERSHSLHSAMSQQSNGLSAPLATPDGKTSPTSGYTPTPQARVLTIHHDDSLDFDEDATRLRAEIAMRTFALKKDNNASQSSSSTAAQAGVILGIHNIFIVIPQLLVSFLSSLIFAFLTPQASGETDIAPQASWNGVAVIFRLGGLSAAVAAYMTWRLSKTI